MAGKGTRCHPGQPDFEFLYGLAAPRHPQIGVGEMVAARGQDNQGTASRSQQVGADASIRIPSPRPLDMMRRCPVFRYFLAFLLSLTLAECVATRDTHTPGSAATRDL